MSPPRLTALAIATMSAALLAPGLALAHHPMDGAMPTTFVEGLLSGIGHPILGLDHLATIVGAALIAAQARLVWPVAGFGAAVLAGVLLHAAGVSLPATEALVGVTALLVGASLVMATRQASTPWLAAVAAFGVLHGLALGETVIGAEPTPIAAYLAGLAFVQAAIVVATTWIYRKLSQAALLSQPLAVRAMGAVVALAGAGAIGATLVG